MKRPLKTIRFLALGLLLTASQTLAQSGALAGTTIATGTTTATGATTVTVTIGAEAGLNIINSSTPLTATGSNFTKFTGSTSLTYSVRTTAGGGDGSITLKVTSDFSPAGGPSVGRPPSPGDALSYTCTVGNPGTPCTGSQTASTSAQRPLATFGADAHTASGGSTASVNWSLTNDPQYKAGTYTATVTFTISAS